MILYIVSWAFDIYFYVLFAYVLMSWVPALIDSPIGQILRQICEPYLSVFRRFIPPIGFLDLSPLVALITLRFVEQGVLIVISWVLRLF